MAVPVPVGGHPAVIDGDDFAARGLISIGRGWRIAGACGSTLISMTAGAPLSLLLVVPGLVALFGTGLLSEDGIRRAAPWVRWVALTAVWCGLICLGIVLIAVVIAIFIVVAVLAALPNSHD